MSLAPIDPTRCIIDHLQRSGRSWLSAAELEQLDTIAGEPPVGTRWPTREEYAAAMVVMVERGEATFHPVGLPRISLSQAGNLGGSPIYGD